MHHQVGHTAPSVVLALTTTSAYKELSAFGLLLKFIFRQNSIKTVKSCTHLQVQALKCELFNSNPHFKLIE